MGLAAGQARLLTITARKSDCEFQSMRLSHQKIALSRELADLSNRYQDSLGMTKLMYDYYGTGTSDMQLAYDLMMSPSALNDYMPVLVTDPKGRVTLDSKLAAAAAAAGIPQEGLGCLPSGYMRNIFVEQLGAQGIIQPADIADQIQKITYNQEIGFGGGITKTVNTEDISYDDLIEKLADKITSPLNTKYDSEITNGINLYNVKDKTYLRNANEDSKWLPGTVRQFNSPKKDETYNQTLPKQLTLADILQGNYVMVAYGKDERNAALGAPGGAIDAVVGSAFWDDMFAEIENLFDTGDDFAQQALDYARNEIEYMISNQCDQSKAHPYGEYKDKDNTDEELKCQYYNDQDLKNFVYRTSTRQQSDDSTVREAFKYADATQDGYIGMCLRFNVGKGRDDDSNMSAVSVNISSVFKAYLTYFADYMNGMSATTRDGIQVYDVNGKLAESHLVDENTMFTIKSGTEVSSAVLGQASFYDALFNQICAHGWTENNNIKDNQYLQQMLQSGMQFVSRVNEDGYYYQGNYATDTYIKEVADESAIAAAEAKYNTEKAKLNVKEETIDLKMKNLDTEISSLTTEYDTVKNTISKNVEKSFKRYNA